MYVFSLSFLGLERFKPYDFILMIRPYVRDVMFLFAFVECKDTPPPPPCRNPTKRELNPTRPIRYTNLETGSSLPFVDDIDYYLTSFTVIPMFRCKCSTGHKMARERRHVTSQYAVIAACNTTDGVIRANDVIRGQGS